MPYKKVVEPPKTIRVRKNDMVKVIAGGDTNKKNPVGRVLGERDLRGCLEGGQIAILQRRHRPGNPYLGTSRLRPRLDRQAHR